MVLLSLFPPLYGVPVCLYFLGLVPFVRCCTYWSCLPWMVSPHSLCFAPHIRRGVCVYSVCVCMCVYHCQYSVLCIPCALYILCSVPSARSNLIPRCSHGPVGCLELLLRSMPCLFIPLCHRTWCILCTLSSVLYYSLCNSRNHLTIPFRFAPPWFLHTYTVYGVLCRERVKKTGKRMSHVIMSYPYVNEGSFLSVPLSLPFPNNLPSYIE